MNPDQVASDLFDKVTGWLEAFILMLPNLALAVIIVVAFWMLARVARGVIHRVMNGISSYTQVNRLLGTVGYVAVLATGAFIALGVLDLDKAVTSLLAGAGIIGLALGFAFQDIAANFISGVLMSIRRPFTDGDIVETNGFLGTIADVNLRSTVIRTFQGQMVYLPNKEVFQNPMTNYSKTGQRRIDLRCGVAYGDDLDQAERLALDAIRSIDELDQSREVDLYYEEFGDSSINFVIRFWIGFEQQTHFLKVRSDAIKRIKRAFDEHGITIPFPIRTLDFGVVGGVNLNEVLPTTLYQHNGEHAAQAAS